MDIHSLIPNSEQLPAPAWLLITLEQLFFLLHIIVVNALLGAALILLFRKIKSSNADLSVGLHEPVAAQLPLMFALGINFAIPPLLFMQVVFGHFFYTSSVLMAVYWIIIIPLLVLGYYGAYVNRINMLSAPVISKLVLSAVVLIILYIGFMLVSNNSLMEQPGKWEGYFSYSSGTLIGASMGTMLPRYFHFIMASIAIGGLFYATMARFNKKEIEGRDEKVKSGLQIFAIGTSLQVIIGFWYLISVPSQFLPYFLGKNFMITIFMVLGICGGITAIISGFLNKYVLSVASVLFTLVCMVLNRLNLRFLYLKDNFSIHDMQIKPQYGVFALFVLILLIGVASIIYMLRISSTKTERSIES